MFKEVVLDLNLVVKLCLTGLQDVSFICFRCIEDHRAHTSLEDGPELLIYLILPPERWNHRCMTLLNLWVARN